MGSAARFLRAGAKPMSRERDYDGDILWSPEDGSVSRHNSLELLAMNRYAEASSMELCIAKIVEFKAYPNATIASSGGVTALTVAVRYHNVSAVSALLTHGAQLKS